MMGTRVALLAGAMVMLAGSSSGAAAPAPMCVYAQKLGLSRWVGEWTGYKANRVSAHERIRLGRDCVLTEYFSGLDGTAGTALIRLRPDGKLEQPYFNRLPNPAEIPGGELTSYDDHRFTFTRNPDAPERSRIWWELIGPGAGRQVLERSADGGQSWTTVFELFLFKRGAALTASLDRAEERSPARSRDAGRSPR